MDEGSLNMAYKDKQKEKEQHHRYYTTHKTEQKVFMHNWYLNNKERVLTKSRNRRLADKQYANKMNRAYRLRIRLDVLTHYGNGVLACVKCGYSDIRALSIDHINGEGNKDRKRRKHNTYKYLINDNYPKGYQTLCMNCQCIKREEKGEMRRRFETASILNEDVKD